MAKKSKAQETPLTARQRRELAKQEAARSRRSQNMLVGGFGLALLAILAGFLFLGIRGRAPVDGEQVFESQGNSHISFGAASPIEYNSVPPSSGPHYDPLVPWAALDEPRRYEELIHNLEDGGVIVYYQCEEECPELVAQITEVAESFWGNATPRNHVVIAENDPTFSINGGQPLHQDMDAKIAAVAWGRVLKLDEFDETALRQFISRYVGIDHHARS